MKKFLILYFTTSLLMMPVFASNLDLSIDDEIRKNYNPSKLEEDSALPALPSILNEPQKTNVTPLKSTVTKKSTIQKTVVQPKNTNYRTNSPKVIQGSFATIKKGTKIKAKLITGISDRTKKGTKITFISKYPVTTTYFTIPSGTTFQGEILNSHKPQLTGNGGLIVINVNSMILNNSIQPLNAYVTKANRKKIFFNNIKGKRKYTKSLAQSLKPGVHFFKKMMRVTSNLANDGLSIILTPFSITAGLIGFGANTAVSPVLALFRKGDSIYLPSGSEFEIKLEQDIFIYD